MFLRRKTIEHLSDEDLVVRFKSGQQSSLAALWDRYAHLLFGVGMKYLKDAERAKDMVVEVFASLPELLGRHEVRSFRPWIHAVTRNRCLMLLRKPDPEMRIDEALLSAPEDVSDDAALHEATLQRLEAAVGELKDAQQTCIRLFYLERNSYQQTAERTGYSVELVRSHIQNGRRNLRLILLNHADH
jgi:RNA polymerase sigma factor (sigma-70 family)